MEIAAAGAVAENVMTDPRVRREGRARVIRRKKKTGNATGSESLRRLRKGEAF